MNLKNKVKKYIKPNSFIERLLKTIYLFYKKPDFLEKKNSFGNKNKDKTIYIIRPNTEDCIQGLMSLFVQTMRKIDYAKRKGYKPIVDFKNYKTQYYNNKDNAWEFFFTQPSNISLEEAYKSKNVILSGATIRKREDMKLFKETIFSDDNICEYCYNLIKNSISLSKEVTKIINEERKNIDTEKCIGVYIRGTDYTKLMPSGEYIQPSIKEMIKKIDEFLEKYKDLNIFLVTEDKNNYESLKKIYHNKIKIVSFDSFIDSKKVNNFLSKTTLLNNNVIDRGRQYLVKEILLSECKYLITSITYGSIAAYAFNGNKYKEKYVFNKGIYK